jgi:hypothetical protein
MRYLEVVEISGLLHETSGGGRYTGGCSMRFLEVVEILA